LLYILRDEWVTTEVHKESEGWNNEAKTILN
jgi:hypothetical protein